MWFSAPVYFQNVWDWSVFQAGMAVTPTPLVVLTLSRYVGMLADRGHLRGCIVGGMATAGSATLAMGLLLAEEPNYWTSYFPAAIVYGVGLAFAWSMLTGAALVGIDERLYGAANGASLTARSTGSALGVAMVIAISGVGSRGHDEWQAVWLTIAGVYALSTVIFGLLYPRR